MTSNHRSGSCVVLLRNLGDGMLSELVGTVVGRLPKVDVYEERLPAGLSADLTIEGDNEFDPNESTTLLVANDGSAVCALPCGQLTESLLTLAVTASRRERLEWLETLLVSCQRIDRLVETATESATTFYNQGGTFGQWPSNVAANADTSQTHSGGDHSDRDHSDRDDSDGDDSNRAEARPVDNNQDGSKLLGSALAVNSEPAISFLDGLAGIGSSTTLHDDPVHPFASIVERYGLDGRQIDVLLLCLVNELDERYSRRFAYLRQDPQLTSPTIDLAAALLANDTASRLELQHDLLNGPLVRHGLIILGPAVGGGPDRTRTIRIDPTLLQILLEDDEPQPDQLVLDPATTARSLKIHPMCNASLAIADALEHDLNPHLWGATEAQRRACALNVASDKDARLITARVEELDQLGAERLWRESLRLDALVLLEFDEGSPNPRMPLRPTPNIMTSGQKALNQSDPTTTGATGISEQVRPNIEVTAPYGEDRKAIWAAAATWTTIDAEGGIDDLANRFPVTIDRACAALTAAAAGQKFVTVPSETVTRMLFDAAADDADGRLVSARPGVSLDDLVVDEETRTALDYACSRIKNRERVIVDQGWDRQSSRLTGTYLMFVGPPGTGKTMAAEAIGNKLDLPVQYLELSALLSRWVGDFEKSVDKAFSAAESNGGIVLINEADAILAKRTEVDGANARYANSNTSHLLSRLEQFRGNVIFTSNLVGANTIDPAFHRRLTATVRFRLPSSQARETLWRSVWPSSTADGLTISYLIEGDPLTSSALLAELAHTYELSGGSIANIARTASFLAADARVTAERGTSSPSAKKGLRVVISRSDVEQAVKLELNKIGDFRSLLKRRVGVSS